MRKLFTVWFALVMALFPVMGVFADELPQPAVTFERDTGTLMIDYQYESEPVPGASFSLYKIADFTSVSDGGIGTTYKSLINGVEIGQKEEVNDDTVVLTADSDPSAILDTVKAHYTSPTGIFTVTCGQDGKATLENLPVGIYLVEETKPAEGFYASVPFLTSVPKMNEEGTAWEFTTTVQPKGVPFSELELTKKLEGNKVEKDRDWHFTITFTSNDDEKEAATAVATKAVSDEVKNKDDFSAGLTYEYTRSDGTTGTVKNGEKITLKGGQTATIHKVPVGTLYTITEDEADQDGYKTTSTDASARIEKNKTAKAGFINSRGGDKDKDKDKDHGGGGSNEKIKTGDVDMRMYMAGAGAACMVIAIVLGRKKRKKEK